MLVHSIYHQIWYVLFTAMVKNVDLTLKCLKGKAILVFPVVLISTCW